MSTGMRACALTFAERSPMRAMRGMWFAMG